MIIMKMMAIRGIVRRTSHVFDSGMDHFNDTYDAGDTYAEKRPHVQHSTSAAESNFWILQDVQTKQLQFLL